MHSNATNATAPATFHAQGGGALSLEELSELVSILLEASVRAHTLDRKWINKVIQWELNPCHAKPKLIMN